MGDKPPLRSPSNQKKYFAFIVELGRKAVLLNGLVADGLSVLVCAGTAPPASLPVARSSVPGIP